MSEAAKWLLERGRVADGVTSVKGPGKAAEIVLKIATVLLVTLVVLSLAFVSF